VTSGCSVRCRADRAGVGGALRCSQLDPRGDGAEIWEPSTPPKWRRLPSQRHTDRAAHCRRAGQARRWPWRFPDWRLGRMRFELPARVISWDLAGSRPSAHPARGPCAAYNTRHFGAGADTSRSSGCQPEWRLKPTGVPRTWGASRSDRTPGARRCLWVSAATVARGPARRPLSTSSTTTRGSRVASAGSLWTARWSEDPVGPLRGARVPAITPGTKASTCASMGSFCPAAAWLLNRQGGAAQLCARPIPAGDATPDRSLVFSPRARARVEAPRSWLVANLPTTSAPRMSAPRMPTKPTINTAYQTATLESLGSDFVAACVAQLQSWRLCGDRPGVSLPIACARCPSKPCATVKHFDANNDWPSRQRARRRRTQDLRRTGHCKGVSATACAALDRCAGGGPGDGPRLQLELGSTPETSNGIRRLAGQSRANFDAHLCSGGSTSNTLDCESGHRRWVMADQLCGDFYARLSLAAEPVVRRGALRVPTLAPSAEACFERFEGAGLGCQRLRRGPARRWIPGGNHST